MTQYHGFQKRKLLLFIKVMPKKKKHLDFLKNVLLIKKNKAIYEEKNFYCNFVL